MKHATFALCALLAGCCVANPEGAGGSSPMSTSTGPDVECASYGTAKSGTPCSSDCDCCGHACSTEGVCAAPCLPDAG